MRSGLLLIPVSQCSSAEHVGINCPNLRNPGNAHYVNGTKTDKSLLKRPSDGTESPPKRSRSPAKQDEETVKRKTMGKGRRRKTKVKN